MKQVRTEIDDFEKTLANDWRGHIFTSVRKAIHEAIADGSEDWKWGPNFKNKDGVMVMNLWAFPKHVAVIFFQGAQIEDKYKLFNASGSSKFMRVIKFFSADEFTKEKLKQIKEYIIVAKDLKKPKIERLPKVKLTIPPYFKKLLESHNLLEKFNQLSYTKKKDHLENIIGAKSEETRQRRIEKALDRINEGKGFYVE